MFQDERSAGVRSSEIDFIPPYSKSYAHRLKLINEKRLESNNQFQSDPIKLRTAGNGISTQTAIDNRLHYSQRTFGIVQPVNRSRSNSAHSEENIESFRRENFYFSRK